MKKAIALLLTLTTFSSFAQNLDQDLKTKDCSVVISKTLTIKKNQMGAERGDISFLTLLNNSKIKLKGEYPILDVSEGIISINKGTNLIFMCINDGDSCLKDLAQVKITDILSLSNNSIKINCK
ncbi:MAG TPA: hypothetical protein VKZ84_00135 [Bacteriovoracaceae bacterium]|nr:hypothetical protein [Bacteriovoracaceae bacterium]